MNQSNPLRINFASLEDIQTLNKIGPRLAKRILDYRTAHGYFQGPEDLANVRGISIAHARGLSDQIDWEIAPSSGQASQLAQSISRLIEYTKGKKLFVTLNYILILISITLGLLFVFTFYLVLTERSVVSVSTKRADSETPYSLRVRTNTMPSQDGFHENINLEIEFEQNLELISHELGVKCLDSLYVELISRDNEKEPRSQLAAYPLSLPCSTDRNTADSETESSNMNTSFQVFEEKGYWYGEYPFELHELTVNFWIEGRSLENERIYVGSGDIEVNIDMPDWSVQAELQDTKANLEGIDEKATQLKLRILRPFGLKLLSTVLLVGLGFFILLLAFVPDTGSALEISVGILLGLWGVQNILIPSNINNQTPIHEAIIFLYLLFGWIAFIRFLLIPVRKKMKESD